MRSFSSRVIFRVRCSWTTGRKSVLFDGSGRCEDRRAAEAISRAARRPEAPLIKLSQLRLDLAVVVDVSLRSSATRLLVVLLLCGGVAGGAGSASASPGLTWGPPVHVA